MIIYIRAIEQQLTCRLYFSVPLSSLTDILPSIRIFQLPKREKFEKQMHRIIPTPDKLSTWKEFSEHGAVLTFPFVQQEENTSGWSKQVIKSKQNNAVKPRRLLFISQNNWRVFKGVEQRVHYLVEMSAGQGCTLGSFSWTIHNR